MPKTKNTDPARVARVAAAARKRGKPPTTGTTRREQLNVRLAAGTTARLAFAAAKANRKPSDWARLAIEAALDRAEALAARDARQAEIDADELAALRTFATTPFGCTCTADVRQADGHAPGCPAGDEIARRAGVVASKSVARRLAATGGPMPACTCAAGMHMPYSVHLTLCPLRAYLEALAANPRT